MSRKPIAKVAVKKQQIHRNRKPVNSLAECIRIWRKFEAFLDEIYWPHSPLDANFAGISRNFAGIFSRLRRLFNKINIYEAI